MVAGRATGAGRLELLPAASPSDLLDDVAGSEEADNEGVKAAGALAAAAAGSIEVVEFAEGGVARAGNASAGFGFGFASADCAELDDDKLDSDEIGVESAVAELGADGGDLRGIVRGLLGGCCGGETSC